MKIQLFFLLSLTFFTTEQAYAQQYLDKGMLTCTVKYMKNDLPTMKQHIKIRDENNEPYIVQVYSEHGKTYFYFPKSLISPVKEQEIYNSLKKTCVTLLMEVENLREEDISNPEMIFSFQSVTNTKASLITFE
ncbi:MAG: hypothetical protein K2X39_08135 [Silvanigrellaceae bacterium]|nr:hypothetical protein [Silvanigrellaceae bacterium]